MLRREFIAASMAGSCLLSLGIADVAAGSPPATSTLLLRTAGHEEIAAGIREVLAQLGRAPPLELALESAVPFDGHSLADLLVRYSGRRLLALTDDGTDVLLNELLRRLRADVLWNGHHVGGRDDADSRHHLWMAAGLSDRSAIESGAPAADDRTQTGSPSFRGPWQRPLGNVLGWLAAGRPVPARVAEFERSRGARLDCPAVRVNSLIAMLRAPSKESIV